MSCTFVHLAVADQIYNLLGDNAIKNLPLFFGGNIAPDAIHAKQNFQRADKKHTHLCVRIASYGYGYPENSKKFKKSVNEFVQNYYLPECSGDGKYKDLYLGYIVHLLLDELEMFSACERLEKMLENEGVITEALTAESRKDLADKVNVAVYTDFFKKDMKISDNLSREYTFKLDVVNILESEWDYEIKDYVSSNEINVSKRWVIDSVLKQQTVNNDFVASDCNHALQFIFSASANIAEKLKPII